MEKSENMKEIINNIIEFIMKFGPLAGVILIILESILPILPLCVFIALNNIIFGGTWGFFISWISTIIGCLLAFYLVRSGFSNKLYIKSHDNPKLKKIMKFITNVKFVELTLIVALPFTPAFLVNIAAGLSKMKKRKFIPAILIGKLSIVYFWGYIGTSFIKSIQNPIILIRLGIIMLIVYLISFFIGKKFNIR